MDPIETFCKTPSRKILDFKSQRNTYHGEMTKVTALLALLLPSAAGFALRSGRVRSPSATSLSASKRLEAILFDCDGVLADTEPDGHRVGFNIAFAQNDIAELWTKERYGKLLETGGGKERMTAHWVRGAFDVTETDI